MKSIIIKKIKTWLNFDWEELELKDVPNWVKKRKERLCKGYDFLYKIKDGKYYRKNRNLQYPEGIPKDRKRMDRWQMNNQVIYQPHGFRDPFSSD